MEEKSVPSSVPSSAPPSTPSTPVGSSASTPKKHEEAWRPRGDDTERVLHGFESRMPEADSILESPEVRDPEKDTAPLQGSKDRSDDDSLEVPE